jgi:16S rRNA (adenine1518-N6/adenine1519-N6)-dimethyltransferase
VYIKGEDMDLWQAATTELLRLSPGGGLLKAVPAFCICASLSQLGILRSYGINLRKSLGQHILIDDNIAQKITAELDLGNGEGVIEIGPGLGALTRRLAVLAKRVVAVEIDRRLVSVLRTETEAAGSVRVEEANILKVDVGNLIAPYDDVENWKVVGNLPYYITSAILMHLVEARQYFSRAVITVQEEFARRLVAGPGSKDYSSLSIYVQYHFRPEVLFIIKPTSFHPRPDVRSAAVRLEALERHTLDGRDEGLFFQTIRAAFGQRRKTLKRSLRQIPGLTPEIMGELGRMSGVGLDNRPEQVSIQQFADLSNAIKDVVG